MTLGALLRGSLFATLTAALCVGCGGGGGGGGGESPGGGPAATSGQIAVARARHDGPVSLAISGAVVTYVKPDVGTDPAGFFVQAEAAGPALFVAVDPATLTPTPAVGDVVTFTITAMGTVGALRQAAAISLYARLSTGASVAALAQDVSAVGDLVTNLGLYESELITCQGTIGTAFTASGSEFVAARLDTTGVLGSSDLVLRLPSSLVSTLGLKQGCVVLVLRTPLWRFNAAAQVSAWQQGDLTVVTCPAPVVTNAVAASATTVVVSFDRPMNPASVSANGSQFAFTGGLVASAAVGSGSQVSVTTSTQTGGVSYTVTVAGTVQDTLGLGVNPAANSASFPGFQALAVLVINEVAPNITASKDLVELRAVAAGVTTGMMLVQNPASNGAGGTVLATLPSLSVAAGDLLVIHLLPSAGVVTETVSKTQCSDPACYAGAWDVAGGTTGIAHSNRVLAIVTGGGGLVDAVAFVAPPSTVSTFPAALQNIQANGHWSPADSGGSPTTYATTPSAIDVSVDWTGAGISATGPTIQRKPIPDVNAKTDWNAAAAHSLGLANP